MKILLLDIETAPNKAYVWGLFKQNISPNQLEASSYVLCWSAQWYGEDAVRFSSVHQTTPLRMLRKVHTLLDTADIVVHYNGLKFDIPTLNKEFVRYGMPPPAPYKQIDLMAVCKRVFRFESNKLDYIARALGIGAKVKRGGFDLWIKCMNGDRVAWIQMEQYNRGDVALLATLYARLRPWIARHPNLSAFWGAECCPKCGSRAYQSRGTILTTTLMYRRYQCKDCGGWFRGNKTVTPKGKERMVGV